MADPVLIDLAGVPLRLEYEAHPPPSEEDLQALVRYAGTPLPPEYVEAMSRMDGQEGWFGPVEDEAYLTLSPCSEVVVTSEAFRLKERGIPLLPVGGDGGGEAFAIDLETGEWVMVPLVDFGTRSSEFRFRNLRALLDAFIADTAFDR